MIASSFGKLKNQESLEKVNKFDLSRSLLTMLSVNTLTFCRMIMQIEKIHNVIWIGTHVDLLQYMQMTQDAFNYLSTGEQRIIFPKYSSFLGSLGILLAQKENQPEEFKNEHSEESDDSLDVVSDHDTLTEASRI